MSIFSSKSFMKRYFQAPISTGPAKPTDTEEVKKRTTHTLETNLKNAGTDTSERSELSSNVLTKKKTEKSKSIKANRERKTEGESSDDAKARRKRNKERRKKQRRTKTKEKAVTAQKAADKANVLMLV